jgi:Na+/H+ antiporter NhaD/arsenite permease-like protein
MASKIAALAMLAALAIFGGTYVEVMIGRIPGLSPDRTGAALLGATGMVAFGVMSLGEAQQVIDFDTITLLSA